MFILSLLSLINSARGLFISVDFFPKNQVLDLLHLSDVPLFSVLFASAFILIICFLLLLDLFCFLIMSVVGSFACNVKLSLFSSVSIYGAKFSEDSVFVLFCPNLFCVIFFWLTFLVMREVGLYDLYHLKCTEADFMTWQHIVRVYKCSLAAPGWLSWLSICLLLKSWSPGSWVRALCWPLCWQLKAWSLLRILCFSHSLLLSCSCSVSVAQKWINVKKKKNRTMLRSSSCTIRYSPKGYKNTDLKAYMHPNVYSSIINNSHTMERVQMSIDCWMDKEDACVCVCVCLYIYVHIYIHIHTGN